MAGYNVEADTDGRWCKKIWLSISLIADHQAYRDEGRTLGGRHVPHLRKIEFNT